VFGCWFFYLVDRWLASFEGAVHIAFYIAVIADEDPGGGTHFRVQ
jgi:hypothetical protein